MNISSGTSRVALPDLIGYTMTKGAIDALTLPLAQHLGPRGITVNTVIPATTDTDTDTDMNASWLRGNSELVPTIAAQNALGRMGEPADVADVVALLASHATGGLRL